MFPLTNKEPYIMSTGERTTLGDILTKDDADIAQLKEALTDEVETRAALGAKNFLKITRTSGTVGNVVITNNGDTLTLEGRANASNNPYVNDNIVLKNGSYILSFGTSAIEARIYGYNGSSWVQLAVGTSDVTFTASSTYTKYMVTMGIINGTTYNTTVYPMIRLATDSDPTYQPYAMTNKELTEDATYKKGDTITISSNPLYLSALFQDSKHLRLTIPINKPISASGATVTINSAQVFNGGNYEEISSGLAATAYKLDGIGLYVIIENTVDFTTFTALANATIRLGNASIAFT